MIKLSYILNLVLFALVAVLSLALYRERAYGQVGIATVEICAVIALSTMLTLIFRRFGTSILK